MEGHLSLAKSCSELANRWCSQRPSRHHSRTKPAKFRVSRLQRTPWSLLDSSPFKCSSGQIITLGSARNILKLHRI